MPSPRSDREPAPGHPFGRAGDDVERLRLVLLRLARRIRTSSAGQITPSQLAVLGSVVRCEQLTVGQIAEHEHVKPPSASKIVAALEQRRLVERRTDPNDRRCAHIVPTAEGIAHIEEVRAAGRTWLATQLGQIDDDDRAAVEAAVPALERLLSGGA